MNITSKKRESGRLLKLFFVTIVVLGLVLPGVVSAKSLYVNKDINWGSPISAYDIQPASNYLVFQNTSLPTRYGGVGLAIDTDSEILFVTFEGSGMLDIVDAKTLTILDQVSAPGAYNLAGIVVDQEKQKVYAVNRSTNHLYVYSWDAITQTLTNDITTSPYYVSLPLVSQGVYGGAYGIALDEVNDLLYVADLGSSDVEIYSTNDWSHHVGTQSVTQKPMGIALDVKNGFLYSGNAYPGYGCVGGLVQTDLSTGVETTLDIRLLSGGVYSDCVVGVAVDPATSQVYVTTGNQASGGSDRILVFDSALNLLYATADIGNPTGIVVPGKDISYNPLNLSKDDGLAEGECQYASQQLTYEICYDNLDNDYDVNNVTIVDNLPAEATFDSASGGGVYDGAEHTVTWSVASLVAGAGEQCVQVSVSLDSSNAGETIINSSTIDSDETPPTTQNASTDICDNLPPTADAGGPYLTAAGAGCPLDGSGSTDPDSDTLNYEWDCGASGETATHVFNEAGLLDVCLTVTDPGGLTDTACSSVVVFDASAGFVTGGGWINSPQGAYVADDQLIGRANFGFISKYKKGQNEPDGQTEFNFSVADLNFHSDSYDWLVVNQGGQNAQFKGSGTRNGTGEYMFMLWAGDNTPDTFRIRIWTEDGDGNETDVYDNGFNQEIAGGSIMIHTKSK